MGRKAAQRDNYRQDAITIHRIASAIEDDERSSPEWKESVLVPLRAVIAKLLDHKFPAAKAKALKKAG